MKIQDYQAAGFQFNHHQGLLVVSRTDGSAFVAFRATEGMTHAHFILLLNRLKPRHEVACASMEYLTAEGALDVEADFHMVMLHGSVLQKCLDQADAYTKAERAIEDLKVSMGRTQRLMEAGLQPFMLVHVFNQ